MPSLSPFPGQTDALELEARLLRCMHTLRYVMEAEATAPELERSALARAGLYSILDGVERELAAVAAAVTYMLPQPTHPQSVHRQGAQPCAHS